LEIWGDKAKVGAKMLLSEVSLKGHALDYQCTSLLPPDIVFDGDV